MVEDAHARFDVFSDQRTMHNKVKDPRYDLTGPLPDMEDEVFSTDLDDLNVAPED